MKGLQLETTREITLCATWFSIELGEPSEVESDGTPVYWMLGGLLPDAAVPWLTLTRILQLRRIGQLEVDGSVVTRWVSNCPTLGRAQVLITDLELMELERT